MTKVASLYGEDWADTSDWPRPDPFDWKWFHLGGRIGAEKIGGSLYEILPGKQSFPYHYEYGAEEWLLCVGGRPTLRTPRGEQELRPGDLVCFPEGPEGAHQVLNRTEEPVRVLILSTLELPKIAVYPDSDKFNVNTGNPDDRLIVRRESGVDYWDGET